MPRRPAYHPGDSLELMLDTLCNTFGGILLLGILVILLLRTAGERADQSLHTPSSMDALRAELNALRQEVGHLRAALAEAPPWNPDHAPALEAQIQLAESERQAAADRGAALSEQAAAALAQAENARRDADQSTHRLAAARARLQRARQLPKAPQTPQAMPGSGELHVTHKTFISLVVRYGRVYLWHDYDPNGYRRGLNTRDFIVLEDTPDGLVTAPRLMAGLPVRENPDLLDQLAKLLGRFPPDRYVLQISLHPDSFNEFQSLKTCIIQLNYKYKSLINSEYGSVFDRGGTDARVQ